MTNIIENLCKGIPISVSASENLIGWRDDHRKNPLAKYVVAELTFAGIGILGVFETVASMISALVLKIISFFIPRKCNFDEKIAIPAKNYAFNSFIATNVAFFSLVDNIVRERMRLGTTYKVLDYYRPLLDRFNVH